MTNNSVESFINQLSLSIYGNDSFLSFQENGSWDFVNAMINSTVLILQLDDYVLCRIYNKKGTIEKQPSAFIRKTEYPEIEDKKPENLTCGGALPPPPSSQAPAAMTDYMYFDTSDSIPKLHTDSSCSEHVVSPEFASEVQSEPKWNEWEKNLEFPYNYVDATLGNNGFGSQFQSGNQMSPLQDMFMYLQKPFWSGE